MRRDAVTEVALVGIDGPTPPVRVGGPYRIGTQDPLQRLADGWVARWSAGDEAAFEVAAITSAAARPEPPDYYLVAGAAAIDGGPFDPPVLRRHWYLGFLASLRPGRVVPGDDPAAGIRMLGAGPWWPAAPELVAAARKFRADALS